MHFDSRISGIGRKIEVAKRKGDVRSLQKETKNLKSLKKKLPKRARKNPSRALAALKAKTSSGQALTSKETKSLARLQAYFEAQKSIHAKWSRDGQKK